MQKGWFKVHRKLFLSSIFKNEKLLKVFIYCLIKSTHTPFEQRVGRQKISLKPGQFVFGRKKAALELDMSESTVYDYMNMLKDDGVINIKATNKYSVVTVVNWDIYQSNETENNKISNNKSDSKITPSEQQNNTNKNIKNAKNNKNKRYRRKRVYDESSVYYQLAIYFYKQIKNNNPNHKEPNFQNWADDIRKMIELDKRTEKQVKYLMAWVQQDDFEMVNVLSPAKLRKRFDGLVMKVRREKNQLPSNVTPITEVKKKKYNYGF